MSVRGSTHEVVCDQCKRAGPTAESLVEDRQGWAMFWEHVGTVQNRLIDLCPKCKNEWKPMDK